MPKKHFKDPNQVTMAEVEVYTHRPIVRINVYNVTFGYYGLDCKGNSIYKNEVSVSAGLDKYPVYAKLVNGRLKELFTGIEIPLPEDERIPGFGAYDLKPVYSLRDYQLLAFYLREITEDKEAYRRAFLKQIEYLETIKKAFLETHNMGPKDDEDRKNQLEQELQDCKREVDEYIGGSGSMSM